jgi:hypothetical protein
MVLKAKETPQYSGIGGHNKLTYNTGNAGNN